MPSKKCQHKVLDRETKRYRLCKLKPFILNYCKCHLVMLYENHIIKIQNTYRAMKIRQKIKWFKQMPNEIQKTICYYINEPLYIDHQNKTIKKIIYKKIHYLFSNIYKQETFKESQRMSSICTFEDCDTFALYLYLKIFFIDNDQNIDEDKQKIIKDLNFIFFLLIKYHSILEKIKIYNYLLFKYFKYFEMINKCFISFVNVEYRFEL